MEKDFYTLMGYFISVMEGDTHHIEDAYELLRKYGIVDKDGFEIFRVKNNE